MTTTVQTPPAALSTAPTTGGSRVATTCCRRAMSGIEVTARGVTLVLHSCTSCGRHVWERDGVQADRAELLEGVKTFLEQPRIPTPRRRRAR
ncbi:MAG: hypothetical protein JWN88_2067 [Frankiales bacterium]|jgi:hypothetical protein|nr:hypothetical protein [Frankiales bacterium]